jgi:mannose-6-phosphate isomerase-like protein (cupin superfamily)
MSEKRTGDAKRVPQMNGHGLVRSTDATCVLWGDTEAGFVHDHIYARSESMVALVIEMGPGGSYSRSEQHTPFFDYCHECLYVLEGEYTIHNPLTGQIVVARQGELISMPDRTWHFGYNFANAKMRVLEIIAPLVRVVPLAEAGPLPVPPKLYSEAAVQGAADAPDRIRLCTERESVPVLLGPKASCILKILVNTPKAWTGRALLLSDRHTFEITCQNDVAYYCEAGGILDVRIADGDYHRALPDDVVFVPAGTPHRLLNHGPSTVSFIAGGAGSFSGWKFE